MLIKHLLCVSAVAVSLALTGFEKTEYDPCESIVISVDVYKTSNSLSRADVKVTGGKTPIRYFFSDNKGELVNQNYNEASVENLKPGRYTCLVREAGNCRKKIEFEVK